MRQLSSLSVETLHFLYTRQYGRINPEGFPELGTKFVEFPTEFIPTKQFPNGKPYLTQLGHVLAERFLFPHFYLHHVGEYGVESLVEDLPVQIKFARMLMSGAHPEYKAELQAQLEHLKSIAGTNEKARKLLEENA